MPKLNQIIAVEKGVKSKAFADLSDAHHAVQKTGPLAALNVKGTQTSVSRGSGSEPHRTARRVGNSSDYYLAPDSSAGRCVTRSFNPR